jgi:hypothetical protein
MLPLVVHDFPNPVLSRIVDFLRLPIAAHIACSALPVIGGPALKSAFNESIDVFSAFGNIDYHSVREAKPGESALKRLDGIGRVLLDLDLARVRTPEDLARALLTLDIADKCIRAIRAEFRTEAANDRLVRKAGNLTGWIERARDELTGCHSATS